MAKIKYCIWDVGQVIYRYSLKPLHKWLTQHAGNFRPPDTETQTFNFDSYMKGQISDKEMCRQLCRFYNIGWINNYEQEIAEALRQGIGEYFSETGQLQNELAVKGIQNCILSNALPIIAEDTKFHDPIDKKYIFCSFDIGLLKPDPRIYEYVQSKLKCDFEEMLFIDNKSRNTAAAAKLGIKTITFRADTIRQEIYQIINN